MPKKHHTIEEKAEIIRKINADWKVKDNLAEICRDHKISYQSYYVWKEQLKDHQQQLKMKAKKGMI